MVSHCEIYKQHFLGKKSRASGSDSSGDEKKGRGRDKAREKVLSLYRKSLSGNEKHPLLFSSPIAVLGQEEEESQQLELKLQQRFKLRLKFQLLGLKSGERLKEEVKETQEGLKGLKVEAKWRKCSQG